MAAGREKDNAGKLGAKHPVSATDAIRDLLISHKAGDNDRFTQAAYELVADARRKKHNVLAREYERILEGLNYPGAAHRRDLMTLGISESELPLDSDRKFPLVEVIDPRRDIEQIILSGDLFESLSEFITEQKQSEILATYGLEAKKRLLFCGPPGCGKSLAAEVIARELYLPLVLVRLDSLVSSYLGETAANLRKVFDFAASRKCVLLFDEFDMIAKERADESEHGELKRVVSAFLQMLDRFRGESVIIAATNHDRMLDVALWRRFDDVLTFPSPTLLQINQLIGNALMPFNDTRESKIRSVATKLLGLSFADIERVCRNAIKAAILSGQSEVTSALLMKVAAKYRSHRRVRGPSQAKRR